MNNLIDDFLNKTTMYRVVLYCLIFIWAAALILDFLKLLPYQPIDLMLATVFVIAVCMFVNFIFAEVFEAPSNIDSVYITALILVLIISPSKPFDNFAFLAWAAVWAMASKYILAIGNKHIFNPAAFAVALTSITIGQSANWWIGNMHLTPFVLIAGALIARKIHMFDLAASFFAVLLSAILISAFMKGQNPLASVSTVLLSSSAIFFAFVMLTEPLTTPPTRKLQIYYGAFVGFLFAPFVHIGSIYSTPELALVIGNVFSYLASPKYKLVLELKERLRVSPDTFDFIFKNNRKMEFSPGQYMEWTLDHSDQDDRRKQMRKS